MNSSDARMRSTNDATSSGCPTNAARTTSAITGWSASRSGRMTTPSATCGDGLLVSGGKQLPVPFGDDLDGTISHLDGGLIVNRVPRHRHPGGPRFCVGHGVLRQVLVIQVRKHRELNQAQPAVATGGRLPEDE